MNVVCSRHASSSSSSSTCFGVGKSVAAELIEIEGMLGRMSLKKKYVKM